MARWQAMSRLIDADVLKTNIVKWLKPTGDPQETEMVKLDDIAISVLMEIEETPTAYDVDKVVEELEDKMLTSSSASAEAIMEMCGVSATFYNGEYEAYKHAIEIVRGGGVNERN